PCLAGVDDPVGAYPERVDRLTGNTGNVVDAVVGE
ncbi:MAG: hypothetical protein QOC92_1795, partial [Acidimicrobiaceae bacterium]